MIDSKSANRSKPSLDGKVFCANCGEEMNNNGESYCCPGAAAELGNGCTTKPMNADNLIHAVIIKMVDRLATDKTVQSVTERIMDVTEASSITQRSRMEQAEAAIAETNARRPAVLHPVEHGAKTYKEVTGEISELDKITAGLSFESMVARNELDKIDFVRDPDGIRETIHNPRTYRNNPDEAQELLELLVQKVKVNTGSATIIYEVPMPSAEQPQGILQDLIIV